MVEIQHDLTDVFARRMQPDVVKLAETVISDLPSHDKEDLQLALSHYRDWNAIMAEDSVAASLHMHYQVAFHRSLFHKQEPGDSDEAENARFMLSDTYAFPQTY